MHCWMPEFQQTPQYHSSLATSRGFWATWRFWRQQEEMTKLFVICGMKSGQMFVFGARSNVSVVRLRDTRDLLPQPNPAFSQCPIVVCVFCPLFEDCAFPPSVLLKTYIWVFKGKKTHSTAHLKNPSIRALNAFKHASNMMKDNRKSTLPWPAAGACLLCHDLSVILASLHTERAVSKALFFPLPCHGRDPEWWWFWIKCPGDVSLCGRVWVNLFSCCILSANVSTPQHTEDQHNNICVIAFKWLYNLSLAREGCERPHAEVETLQYAAFFMYI